MTVKVEGKALLFAKLRKLAPEMQKALEDAGEKTAREMVSAARNFAPVKSGALRDSIVATPPGGSPPRYSQGSRSVPLGAWLVSAGDTHVRYAHLVEFGTNPHIAGGIHMGAAIPHVRAQPFFWPAYRIVRKRHKARASRAITSAIKKVGG